MRDTQVPVVRGVFESAALSDLVGRVLARNGFSLQPWESLQDPGTPATHRLPEEEGGFVRSVRWAWVGRVEVRVNEALDETAAPAPVRAAVRLLVRQRPPDIARRTIDARRSSLRWMAEEIGCSPDYLSRASAACGVALRLLSDLWMLLLATVLWQEFGTREAVARRLGYRSTSGLSGLVKRCVGHGGLGRFERDFLGQPERIARRCHEAVAGSEDAGPDGRDTGDADRIG